MVLVRILKRKDASSVIVAVAVGLVLYSFISSFTQQWAVTLSSGNPSVSSDWHNQYLYPAVWAALELLVLEILGWVYVLAVGMTSKK